MRRVHGPITCLRLTVRETCRYLVEMRLNDAWKKKEVDEILGSERGKTERKRVDSIADIDLDKVWNDVARSYRQIVMKKG